MINGVMLQKQSGDNFSVRSYFKDLSFNINFNYKNSKFTKGLRIKQYFFRDFGFLLVNF